jgi:hypothetical protein
MKRLRRFIAFSVYYAIITPWYLIAVPVGILSIVADWYAFTADRWLQNKLVPVRQAFYAVALRCGRFLLGKNA